MFRSFYILLFLGCFSISISKTPVDNFKVSYPHFIQKNSRFQVSFITSKLSEDAEYLELVFNTGSGVGIENIEVKTTDGNFKPEILRGVNNSKFNNAIKCVINLKDELLFMQDDFFQVVLICSSGNVTQSELSFTGQFLKDELIVGYFEGSSDSYTESEPGLFKIPLEFYQPTNFAGNLISFGTGAELNIPLKFIFMNKLLAEFWIRFDIPADKFLRLIDGQTNREIYSLSVNNFFVLAAESELYQLSKPEPHIISAGNWYHISVLLSADDSFAFFYINGAEFTRIELPQYININDLIISFNNEFAEPVFGIDQLRIIDLKGSLQQTFRIRNFRHAEYDSAHVLLQINGTNEELINLANNSIITYQNTKLTKSDAPVFARAPELNISILNNYYELDWSGGDFQSALKYVVERADDVTDFVKVFDVDADRKNSKIYSYIAEKRNTSEVVYFRVKQINTDGTEVYSAQVKVGQGQMEDIILGQNYPNPFNPTTKIEFELLQDADVEVKVYNVEGKEVAILHKGSLSKGVYQFDFNGSDLPSGIYLYKVSTPQFTQTKKMILAK